MKRIKVLLISAALLGANGDAADWPMWRTDVSRTGSTPEALPEKLTLAWTLTLPPPMPAWPEDQTSLLFDTSYEPICAGGLLLVPSNVTDSLNAFDAGSGEPRWSFSADGPVRFAPSVANGKVFLVSDDGYLYCLKLDSGELLWRFRGAPEDRLGIGNHRLISLWPARGAPVVGDGVVYFAAGIWPFMGIFIHAVDAETGKSIWCNSGVGATYITQPHSSPAFAGIAPQGYLVLSGETLLVPGGRSVPAAYDPKTGEQRYFEANHGKGTGGYQVAAGDSWFLNHDILFDLAKGDLIERGKDVVDLPVLSGGVAYSVLEGKVVARPIAVQEEERIGRRGKAEKQLTAWRPPRWEFTPDPPIQKLHLAAGNRLYGGAPGIVMALDIPQEGGQPKVVWTERIEGDPWSMIASDGRLFVVTREGCIHCFAGGSISQVVRHAPPGSSGPEGSDSTSQDRAAGILRDTDQREGYALVFGLSEGGLVEDLVAQSNLHVIAIDPDPTKVAGFRERMAARDLYGRRASAIARDPQELLLPLYVANLIVVEGADSTSGELTTDRIRTLFESLRPYGGTACLPTSSVKAVVQEAALEGAEVEKKGDWILLRRPGPLPGSAPWTHQYADSANSVVSRDKLVKAPLGVLWFGGPSHQGILPKHGHGPSEQVIGGRLFIEGPDMLRAVDVYTGRLLWEKSLPGVGAKYDETGHQPGANATGANYVSLEDGIYIIHGKECLRLDPASGEVLSRFVVPSEENPSETEEWGFLNARGNVLLAATSPSSFDTDIEFHPDEFRKVSDEDRATVTEWVETASGKPLESDDFEKVVDTLSDLLADPHFSERLSLEGDLAAKSETARGRIADYLKAHPEPPKNDTLLKSLNRALVETIVPDMRPRAIKVGGWIASGISSRRLVAMDRHTGKILWSRKARHAFIHNSIILGGGKAFCLDRLPDFVVKSLERRGKSPDGDFALLALDALTGEPVWSEEKEVFGTWLGYSEQHDILIQATRFSRDMLPEPNERICAFTGGDGKVLWNRSIEYSGPCMMHGETLITQGFSMDLRTGAEKMRDNPLTGEREPWTFERNYGCNYAVGGQCLLTFRSAAAGFYDLERDGGTGNLGGFRSGCTSNLIPADGVLNAPDYTRTCICTYQIQTSLALVHMPEAEMWTFTPFKSAGKEPIRRLGLNLGAPGDRVAEDGTLWLDYPSVGGSSPDAPVEVKPKEVRWFRHHATSLAGEGHAWVNASGAEGISELQVPLGSEGGSERTYTVKLYFAEPEAAKSGERVMDVFLQGRKVLDRLDIAAEAGGRLRGIVKEFKGAKLNGSLEISLAKADPNVPLEPVLSGVEILPEGW